MSRRPCYSLQQIRYMVAPRITGYKKRDCSLCSQQPTRVNLRDKLLVFADYTCLQPPPVSVSARKARESAETAMTPNVPFTKPRSTKTPMKTHSLLFKFYT